ncbi:MAG: hypothetical protein ACD_56C00105G0001 [uncultured bacterium]|nr:MAG: hypothetical protein ACD_56C00105G0001 [uncultured bacterium]
MSIPGAIFGSIDKKDAIMYTLVIKKPPGLFKKPNFYSTFIMNKMFNKIKGFILEAKAEMLKVNWPTKKQTINYTGLVVAVSVVVAGFLGGLDSVFGYVLRTYIIK